MIVKEYSCEDCIHTQVCAYEQEMKYYFDKIQKHVDDNDYNVIPTFKTLRPPIAAQWAVKCDFFIKKEY